MTVPVARTSARRTVRVAAGLVAGQAVLCAVIGYVTLGGHGSPGMDAGRIVDPLAGHPLVSPVPAVPLPSPTTVAPKPPTAARSTTARPQGGARSRHRPEVTPAPTPAPTLAPEPPPDILVATSQSTADPATAAPSVPAPDATSTTASSGQTPPSPPVSLPTQLSVTVGASCDPVNAPGVTADGIAVHCTLGGDGVPNWQRIG